MIVRTDRVVLSLLWLLYILVLVCVNVNLAR